MNDKIDTTINEARIARGENRHGDAAELLVTAIAACRARSDVHRLAIALCDLGRVVRDLGKLEESRLLYEEAASLSREQGNIAQFALALRLIGDIDRHLGNIESASHHYQEALGQYKLIDPAPALDMANTLRGLALLEQSGNTETARQLWSEARTLYVTVQVNDGVIECDERLSALSR